MNKLFFLTLAAFVAGASAAAYNPPEMDDEMSQLALFENDEIETKHLEGERKVYSDFCLKSRDYVKQFMKEGLHDAAARVFGIMFNSIQEVNQELLIAGSGAIEGGVKLIQESGVQQPEAGETKTKEEIEADIKSNVAKVGGLLSTIGSAVQTVMKAVIDTVSQETSRRLALLKAEFANQDVRQKIEEACLTITDVKRELEGRLGKEKKELEDGMKEMVETDIDLDSYKRVIMGAKLNDVGCTTTYRIAMVSRFCDVLITIGPVFYPLVGL